MNRATGTVFTVGHSNHSLEEFVALLQQHGVSAVADVRSAPYSRFHPQFNREPLKAALENAGIRYVFLGRELGARSNDPKCYEDGRVRYTMLAQTDLFAEGLRRVLEGSRQFTVALMCAEKEPLECHRTLLVARALDEQDVPVVHILVDGTSETHQDAMRRLLAVHGLPPGDLFRSIDECLREALARQEARISYRVAEHDPVQEGQDR